jgi:uncharacterized protein
MRFEWDENKSQANIRKHKVGFELSALVFDDPYAITTLERIVDDEERWQTIGMAGGLMLILVVHTHKDDDEVIRIISARKATRSERKIYEDSVS